MQFERVIPIFCVLNEWILSPPKISKDMLSEKLVSYFQINESNKNCFSLYSSILNKIQSLRKNGQIASFDFKQRGLFSSLIFYFVSLRQNF